MSQHDPAARRFGKPIHSAPADGALSGQRRAPGAAEPAVSAGVVQIVALGLATGALGVGTGAALGLGGWGLVLSYVLAGNIGVALTIRQRLRAA